MTNPIDLSIIIPAYKEGPQFGQRLDKLAEFLRTRHYGNVEVVVMMQSDDDSGDHEAAEAAAKKYPFIRIVNLGKRAGKGGAVRAGMFEASGRYRMFMDADLATPLTHLDEVHDFMQRGGQVAIAVRDLATIHKGILRKLITTVGNVLAQIVLLPGIKDTQCGFKAFKAEVVEEVFSRQTIMGWGFDMEVLALARKFGYQIETIEANDWKDPKTEGLVGDSAAGAAIQVFRDMLKIRWKLLTGQYKHKTFHYEKQRTA